MTDSLKIPVTRDVISPGTRHGTLRYADSFGFITWSCNIERRQILAPAHRGGPRAVTGEGANEKRGVSELRRVRMSLQRNWRTLLER